MLYCPVCTQRVIRPVEGLNILWLVSKPTEDEYKFMRLISGGVGDVTRKEFLQIAKMDPILFSRASLWPHLPNQDENCLSVGIDLALNFAKEKQIIILVGSEAVSTFTGMKVSDVNGLDVKSRCGEFFKDAKHVFAMVNPGIAFSKGIGEIRFAIQSMKPFLLEVKNGN